MVQERLTDVVENGQRINKQDITSRKVKTGTDDEATPIAGRGCMRDEGV